MGSALLWLFSGSLIFQTLQIGVFPILITQILARIGTGTHIIGIIAAISWVAVFTFGPFAPALIRKLNYWGANLLAMLTTVTAFFGLLLSDHLVVLLVCACAMGFGLIMRWIACDTLVVEMAPEGARGRTIGLHEALMGLGIAIGPLFFAVLDLQAIAMAGILLSICAQSAFWLAEIGKLQARGREESAAPGNLPLIAIAASLAAAFVAGFVENSAIAMFPLHFAGFGFSLSASAVLVSAFGFGGTILQPPLGYLSDRKGHAFARNLCIAAIIAACLIAAAAAHSFLILYAALFVLGAAAGGLNTLAVIEAGSILRSGQIPAAMTAIAMTYTIGSISGPAASGIVLELLAGRGLLFLFIGCALISAAVIAVLNAHGQRVIRRVRE